MKDREKVLAARAAGIRRVILPKKNQSDLREVPEQIREELDFVLIDRIDELLPAVFPKVATAISA